MEKSLKVESTQIKNLQRKSDGIETVDRYDVDSLLKNNLQRRM